MYAGACERARDITRVDATWNAARLDEGPHPQGTNTEGRAPQRTHHWRGGPHRGPTQNTHRPDGQLTEESKTLLTDLARNLRLVHLLFWADVRSLLVAYSISVLLSSPDSTSLFLSFRRPRSFLVPLYILVFITGPDSASFFLFRVNPNPLTPQWLVPNCSGVYG